MQKSISSKDKVRSIALFSPEIQTEKEYIQKLNVEFDEVRKVQFESLKIQATPTVLILDKNGIVESVWNGRLSPQKESDFLSRLD